MIYFNGKKYACLKCIRGHRTKTCDHRDRVLLEVRRRGRPGQIEAPRKTVSLEDAGEGEGFVTPPLNPSEKDDGDYNDTDYVIADSVHRTTTPGTGCCTAKGSPAGSPLPSRVEKKPAKLKPLTRNLFVPVGNGYYRRLGDEEPLEQPRALHTPPLNKWRESNGDDQFTDARAIGSGLSSDPQAVSQNESRSQSQPGLENGHVHDVANESKNGNGTKVISTQNGDFGTPAAANELIHGEIVEAVTHANITAALFQPLNSHSPMEEKSTGTTASNAIYGLSLEGPNYLFDGVTTGDAADYRNNNYDIDFAYTERSPLAAAPYGGVKSPSESEYEPERDSHGLLSIIAPMHYNGTLFSDLGIGNTNLSEVSYTPSCALGECQCGESCQCYGCAEHDPQFKKPRPS